MKAVSDTHFYHDKIREFHRPEFLSVEDMNEGIIDIWNKNISKTDKVMHLGDFAFGTDLVAIENIIKRLNGNITLILGNHETALKVRELYIKYFKVLGSMSYGNYYFSHEPVHATVIDPDQIRSDGRQATINVHGHLHNGAYVSEKHINCCLDVVGIKNMVMDLKQNE